MNFFYKKSCALVCVKEVEFKAVVDDYADDRANDALAIFFDELERLIIAHQAYILFFEMYNVLYLLSERDKSERKVIHFFNIILSLKNILVDLFSGNSVYADVFLTLFKTGLMILSRDFSLLHYFFDRMNAVETRLFLDKILPEGVKILGCEVPKKSIADILLRSVREANLLCQVEYLLSKGVSVSNGTVLQEIIRQLPEHSRLRICFLNETIALSDLMGVYLQQLTEILASYKARLFSQKSKSSDKAAKVLENNLLDSHPSFAKIMINMTRFMAEKSLLEKPGELFKRLFALWQAGLWILSQHVSECDLFLRISDNSTASILRCRLWTEALWEKKAVLKMTVGEYLMRIAVETYGFPLQTMLASRGVGVAESTLFTRLHASVCKESALEKYFRNETLKNTPVEAVSPQICYETLLTEARDSLGTQEENLSERSWSSANSSWFFREIFQEEAGSSSFLSQSIEGAV